MGERFWMGLALVLCVGSAWAGGSVGVRKQVESSLLVTGTIDLHPDGRVAGYALDDRAAMPAGIAALIERAVPQWRFEPIDLSNGTTRARANMSLRLVAKKMDDGDFSVEIRSAQFGQDRPGETVSSSKLDPPRYPADAARYGVGGTVYTVVKIGRDGRVEDAMVEQVNLRVVTDEGAMDSWRKLLAKAALRAARAWTFSPPTKGEEMDEPYWSARVPVDFLAPDQRLAKEGQWEAYVPGPRTGIPWEVDDVDAEGADAFAGGGVYQIGAGPRLLTALNSP